MEIIQDEGEGLPYRPHCRHQKLYRPFWGYRRAPAQGLG
jgi:hypothetical protein